MIHVCEDSQRRTLRHLAPGENEKCKVSSQFKNNSFAEMCSGSEAGSYLRRIDFLYHSPRGLRVINKVAPHT